MLFSSSSCVGISKIKKRYMIERKAFFISGENLIRIEHQKKTVVIFDMSHDRVVGVAVKTAVALKNDRLFDSLYFSPPVF